MNEPSTTKREKKQGGRTRVLPAIGHALDSSKHFLSCEGGEKTERESTMNGKLDDDDDDEDTLLLDLGAIREEIYAAIAYNAQYARGAGVASGGRGEGGEVGSVCERDLLQLLIIMYFLVEDATLNITTMSSVSACRLQDNIHVLS